MSDRAWRTIVVVLALGVLCGWAAGVADWAFVGDDAYISFRYARNLVRGEGLVWNPGEWVEGYTNFLWTLLMAGGLAVGADAATTSQVLGIAAGAGVLAVLFARGAERHGLADPWIVVAPALVASLRPFQAWSTGGLETSLHALLVLAGLWQAGRERLDTAHAPWISGLLLALATLDRPDGVLLLGVAGLLHALDAVRGDRPWAHARTWLVAPVALVGGHLVLRWLLYGDVVPNTFHAKVNGLWVEQGMAYLGLFHTDFGAAWWAWIGLVPLVLARRRDDAVLAAGVLVHLAYTVAVGGDRFEFRFLVFVLPAWMALVADGLRLLSARTPRPAAVRTGLALTMIAALVWAGRQPHGPMRKQVESLSFIASFADKRAQQGAAIRRLVDAGQLPADLRLCVGAAGALPYEADLWALDYFGLTDPEVAQRATDPSRRIVAHEHTASPEDLRDRGVDVYDAVGFLVPRNDREARKGWTKMRDKLDRIDRRRDVLQPVCLDVNGTRLVFATPLGDAELRRRLGPHPRCDDALDGGRKRKR